LAGHFGSLRPHLRVLIRVVAVSSRSSFLSASGSAILWAIRKCAGDKGLLHYHAVVYYSVTYY
jgi:hypothetical protein